MVDLVQTGDTRVFTIDGSARPSEAPVYQGYMKAGALSWGQGDVTLVRVPDPNRYGKYLVVDKVTGEEGTPELTLMARYTSQLSALLKYARKKCDIDVQVHIGQCQDPQDRNKGWDKIGILERARPTNYGTTDLGALGSDENAQVNEEVPVAGEDWYEVVRITFASKAGVQVTREVVDIIVCDNEECGDCGTPSDGCNVVFALVKSSDSSPGIPAEIVFTTNGGDTWSDRVIDTLAVAEDPNNIACVGTNVVVTSQEDIGLHYIPISDLLAGTGSWTRVTTGLVAGGAPRAIISVTSVHTWIVGLGGYIYFADDPTSLVTVQDAGVATTQQLNDIHGIDINNLVAVGNSNAVVFTTNGGTTWQALTGPAVGVNLNAVWMKDERTWFVGTAGGRLYYTGDAGASWTEKAFPGSGAGVVRDIKFSTNSVGYMAHSTATPAGRILRTIDGGYSWYIAPEGTTSLPANDYIGALAVCADPNTVFGGGLDDAATDGIIVKGAGS